MKNKGDRKIKSKREVYDDKRVAAVINPSAWFAMERIVANHATRDTQHAAHAAAQSSAPKTAPFPAKFLPTLLQVDWIEDLKV